jgi:hypothetical protein
MSQQTAVRSGATSCYLPIRQIRSVTLSFLYCNCMYNVHKCTSRTLSYHNSGLHGWIFIECTNLNLNLCFVFQKYFVLRAKKGLITDGLFSLCRNPNYLGEMMIYGSFAGHPQ